MKRKTRIERVYNEDTGWFETREVELNSCLIREKVVTFRMVKLNMLLSIFLITK